MIKIAPSILAADFACLGAQVREADEAGANYIHVDVMDGQFVPNLTIGVPVVRALAGVTALPLDVHLMIESPENLIDDFVEAGAEMVTVHVETCPHLHRTVSQIREAGAMAGVALNPATPVSLIEPILEYVNLVLVMSVNPGFGGQSFIQGTLPKVRKLRELLERKQLSVEIEIDGGINPRTAPRAVTAGADVLVAGTAIFNARASVADNIAELRRAVGRPERLRKVPTRFVETPPLARTTGEPLAGRLCLASDVMTSPVVTVSPTMTVTGALHLMREQGISSVLVDLGDKSWGIMTQRDVLNKVVTQDKNPDYLEVREIMTTPLITVTPDTELHDCSVIMIENNIRRLPVEADGNIVGIISDTDIFAAVEQGGWGT
jgi:ribulose-phosphate 3-epimerase